MWGTAHGCAALGQESYVHLMEKVTFRLTVCPHLLRCKILPAEFKSCRSFGFALNKKNPNNNNAKIHELQQHPNLPRLGFLLASAGADIATSVLGRCPGDVFLPSIWEADDTTLHMAECCQAPGSSPAWFHHSTAHLSPTAVPLWRLCHHVWQGDEWVQPWTDVVTLSSALLQTPESDALSFLHL